MNNIKKVEVEIKLRDLCVILEKINDRYKINWVEGDKSNDSVIYTKEQDITLYLNKIKKYGNLKEKFTNKVNNFNLIKLKLDDNDISFMYDKYIPDAYEMMGDFIIAVFSQLPFRLRKYILDLNLSSEYAIKEEEYI